MQPWTANLVGLGLGFAIGGAGLFVYFSHDGSPRAAPAAQVAAQPAMPSVNPPPRPDVQPEEMPRVIAIAPPRADDTLPQVFYPDAPTPKGEQPHKPGTAIAGTGFFVASDATLITAAHVVPGCRETRIASSYIRPAAAHLLIADRKHDIALLRAANVDPPALLTLGRPAAASGRLFVLGYPATGGPLIPTETWGDLENAHLQPGPTNLTDPTRMIWAEAPVVAHGFSGGPMVDPRNGAVVGIVRGLVDSARLHAERAVIPASGMVIGPGSSPLAALLQQEGTDSDALPVSGEDALDTARRATVHVICVF